MHAAELCARLAELLDAFREGNRLGLRTRQLALQRVDLLLHGLPLQLGRIPEALLCVPTLGLHLRQACVQSADLALQLSHELAQHTQLRGRHRARH